MQESSSLQLTQVRAVQFRLDYIHAERLITLQSTSQPVNIMFNLNVLTTNIAKHDTTLEIPFVVNISSVPSIISVTLRGAVIIQFENPEETNKVAQSLSEGKVPDIINMIIMQYVIFEVSLIIRELGLPPMIPLPPQLQPRQDKTTTEVHYA